MSFLKNVFPCRTHYLLQFLESVFFIIYFGIFVYQIMIIASHMSLGIISGIGWNGIDIS